MPTEINRSFQSAAGQAIGARDMQEDAFLCIERPAARGGAAPGSQALLVVADGMGGHDGGDVASALVVDAVQRQLPMLSIADPADGFLKMVEDANAAIAQEVAAGHGPAGMGTTLTAAILGPDGLRWVSVGDSLLLLIRDGTLRRLNADHSMAPQLDAMAARGDITVDEAANSPSRNRLRSVLNGSTLGLVDIHADPEPVGAGDIVIVATDGLLSLDDARIVAIATKALDASEIVADLLAEIEKRGITDQDNVTIVAAKAPTAGPGEQLHRTSTVIATPRDPAAGRRKVSASIVWLLVLAASVALGVAVLLYVRGSQAALTGDPAAMPNANGAADPQAPVNTTSGSMLESFLDKILPVPTPSHRPDGAGSAPTVAVPSRPNGSGPGAATSAKPQGKAGTAVGMAAEAASPAAENAIRAPTPNQTPPVRETAGPGADDAGNPPAAQPAGQPPAEAPADQDKNKTATPNPHESGK